VDGHGDDDGGAAGLQVDAADAADRHAAELDGAAGQQLADLAEAGLDGDILAAEPEALQPDGAEHDEGQPRMTASPTMTSLRRVMRQPPVPAPGALDEATDHGILHLLDSAGVPT
jgi:hypothetical protein